MTTEAGVATITFNRPDKLNALNDAMLAEFKDALDRVSRDPEIRVLLLTGAGRSFIAGADIQVFLEFDPLAAQAFAASAHETGFKLEALPIPVIAAVNGFALAAARRSPWPAISFTPSTTARFGQPEIKLGIIPGFGGTQRAVPAGRQGRGQGIGSDRAHHRRQRGLKPWGLVARVFPADVFMEEFSKAAGPGRQGPGVLACP